MFFCFALKSSSIFCSSAFFVFGQVLHDVITCWSSYSTILDPSMLLWRSILACKNSWCSAVMGLVCHLIITGGNPSKLCAGNTLGRRPFDCWSFDHIVDSSKSTMFYRPITCTCIRSMYKYNYNQVSSSFTVCDIVCAYTIFYKYMYTVSRYRLPFRFSASWAAAFSWTELGVSRRRSMPYMPATRRTRWRARRRGHRAAPGSCQGGDPCSGICARKTSPFVRTPWRKWRIAAGLRRGPNCEATANCSDIPIYYAHRHCILWW